MEKRWPCFGEATAYVEKSRTAKLAKNRDQYRPVMEDEFS